MEYYKYTIYSHEYEYNNSLEARGRELYKDLS
jgi:hypothetical protein